MAGNPVHPYSGDVRMAAARSLIPGLPPAHEHLTLDLTFSCEAASVDRTARHRLADHARQALEHLNLTGECRVRIAADDEVVRAHQQHLGKPGTTDVITFDLSDHADQPGRIDADLLVCFDEAERQSRAVGRPVEHELLLYILHGVLHCLGYDDHDESEAQAMHEKEDEILTAIGVGPVFADRAVTQGDSP